MPQSKNILLPLVFLVLLFIGAGYLYLKTDILNVFLSPSQKLERALEKTAAVNSLYLKYEMKGTTKITQISTGVSKSLDYIVRGDILGSTDGNSFSSDMEISSPLQPEMAENVEIVFSDGEYYVKGRGTQGTWLMFTEDEFSEFNTGRADAYIYPLTIVSTILSEENALFNSLDEGTVQYLGRTDDGMDEFTVEVSVPALIDALSRNEDFDAADIKDAEEILNKGVVSLDLVLDPKSGYVTEIVLKTDNLSLISEEDMEERILTSEFDIETVLSMSRFNLPNNISKPTDFVRYSDLDSNSGIQESVLGVSSKYVESLIK